jgi:RNA polymerase sigma-70 factor (ECF subfamily)
MSSTVMSEEMAETNLDAGVRRSGSEARRGRSKLSSMDSTRYTLIQRVRDPQNQQAWAEFMALYEPLLFSYVKKKGLGDTDAQDVVQGIFISLWRTLPGFQLDKSRGRFRTWLWMVTSNAVTDWARSRQRGERVKKAWGESRSDVTVDPDPEAEFDEALRRRVLEFALEKVKEDTNERTWACFELHMLKHRSAAEVAAELGLTTANSVYVNASRVLAKVREKVAEYMEEETADAAEQLSS